jgi:hypothetical protein
MPKGRKASNPYRGSGARAPIPLQRGDVFVKKYRDIALALRYKLSGCGVGNKMAPKKKSRK